jgi:hypothetical protein
LIIQTLPRSVVKNPFDPFYLSDVSQGDVRLLGDISTNEPARVLHSPLFPAVIRVAKIRLSPQCLINQVMLYILRSIVIGNAEPCPFWISGKTTIDRFAGEHGHLPIELRDL